MEIKVTDRRLQGIGIFPDKNRLNPNRYWCNIIQEHIALTKDNTMNDVVQIIYNKAFELGKDEGKAIRSNQFKALINNVEK